jgi:hypothetical protein
MSETRSVRACRASAVNLFGAFLVSQLFHKSKCSLFSSSLRKGCLTPVN